MIKLATLQHDGWEICGSLVRRNGNYAVLTDSGKFSTIANPDIATLPANANTLVDLTGDFENSLEDAYWKFDGADKALFSQRDRFKHAVRALVKKTIVNRWWNE